MTRQLIRKEKGQVATSPTSSSVEVDAKKDLATTTLSPVMEASSKPEKRKTIIHASLLITGPASSSPMKDRTVIIEDGKITSIEHTSDLSTELSSSPSVTVPVLMPGLWDVSCLSGTDIESRDVSRDLFPMFCLKQSS